jgi:2-hydroxy-3-keto-5-methylthiopentenyl-1-phosphate phosphatase
LQIFITRIGLFIFLAKTVTQVLLLFFYMSQTVFFCHFNLMKTTNFWEPSLDQFLNEIDDYLSKQTGPQYAAFDADGTCWFNDVGREVFLHQCQTVYKGKWTWDDYAKREIENVEDALWWMAEINVGRRPEDVIQDAENTKVARKSLKLIPSTKKLISFLKERSVEVYIVTASVAWSIVPAAAELGIDRDHILGVETEIDKNGLITTNRHIPLTWTHGKAEAILKATKGRAPMLCGGNSISDIYLLDTSCKFKMGIRSVDPEESLFDRENELMELCQHRNWPHFDYHEGKYPTSVKK